MRFDRRSKNRRTLANSLGERTPLMGDHTIEDDAYLIPHPSSRTSLNSFSSCQTMFR